MCDVKTLNISIAKILKILFLFILSPASFYMCLSGGNHTQLYMLEFEKKSLCPSQDNILCVKVLCVFMFPFMFLNSM